jgi:hypothetical protein
VQLNSACVVLGLRTSEWVTWDANGMAAGLGFAPVGVMLWWLKERCEKEILGRGKERARQHAGNHILFKKSGHNQTQLLSETPS